MASKKLNFSKVTNKLNAVRVGLLKYQTLIFIVLILGIYSFLVFRINSLVSSEPTDTQITEKLQTVQRPKIDQASIDKIQQLQDNSVEVQTLFKATRDNPFQE